RADAVEQQQWRPRAFAASAAHAHHLRVEPQHRRLEWAAGQLHLVKRPSAPMMVSSTNFEPCRDSGPKLTSKPPKLTPFMFSAAAMSLARVGSRPARRSASP